jgi:hypothetical protein
MFTLAAGEERRVMKDAVVVHQGARYSVPHQLVLERVLVRQHAGEVIISHAGPAGLREVARHQSAGAGSWSIDDAHYPQAGDPLKRELRPRTSLERDFLALGEGAETWLRLAAAAGTSRIKRKMQDAVDLAGFHEPASINQVLDIAAKAGRFAEGDLASILAYQQNAMPGEFTSAADAPSLQSGTISWDGFGQ